MRAVALLFLPVLAALACVGAVTIATGSPARPGETQSFVWKKRAFTSKQEFAAWLKRRNVSYAGWAERHPGASPPWEDEGYGLGRLALLAGVLALILALLVRARDTVSGFARGALLSVVGRLHSEATLRSVAPAQAGFVLRDAVSVYGLRAPRGAEPRQEPERPELVLVEAPPAESVVAVEPEPDPVAVEPPSGAAVAAEPDPEIVVEAPPVHPEPNQTAAPVELEPEAVAVDAPPDSSAPLEPAPVEELVMPESTSGPAASLGISEPEVEQEAPSADREAALVQPMDEEISIDHVPVDAGEVVCEVAFWPGYVRGQFYARIRGDEFSAIATSPLFRCRSATPEQTEECHAALAALNDRLVAEGWQANGRGRAWYARRFTSDEAA